MWFNNFKVNLNSLKLNLNFSSYIHLYLFGCKANFNHTISHLTRCKLFDCFKYNNPTRLNLILFKLLILILIYFHSTSASPLSHRNDDFNQDVLCANQAFDLIACQNYARNKWGQKQDERNLCCYFIEVQTCVIKRREEFCRGEFLDAFKKEYQRNMDHWKNTKCRNYFQNTNCEEEFEIWTLAALIMLCLISSMACITLGVLYTKK